MLEILIPFTIAIIILTITPGLDTTLIIRTASLENHQSAFQTALGISFGCMVWGIIVACGLGALLATSELAFNCLKWIGAAYLAWLGLQLLIKPRSHLENQIEIKKTTNYFLKGFFCNILNPKVGLFYVTFLPQFIPSDVTPFFWIMGLVTIHVVLGLLWSSILIFMMQPISRFLKQPKIVRRLDQITGTIFLLFAIKLVMSKR
ncbi:LysE family translocator [Acinetobacter tandoii]|uniref:LysE family translocator n=1 Tax=Acinetobacter tandoii TaxID=202954 RepID=A0A5N4W5P5_9GAMM|nr:LysE family translocator [Acinetobacter tandoii]KAB1852334.1 LysE family translocator [Acinetobacter tandoii]